MKNMMHWKMIVRLRHERCKTEYQVPRRQRIAALNSEELQHRVCDKHRGKLNTEVQEQEPLEAAPELRCVVLLLGLSCVRRNNGVKGGNLDLIFL